MRETDLFQCENCRRMLTEKEYIVHACGQIASNTPIFAKPPTPEPQAEEKEGPERIWVIRYNGETMPRFWIREPSKEEVAIGFCGIPYVPASRVTALEKDREARQELQRHCEAMKSEISVLKGEKAALTAEVERLKEEVRKAKRELEVAADQCMGIVMCLKAHGQSIDVGYLIDHYGKFADRFMLAARPVEESPGKGEGERWGSTS